MTVDAARTTDPYSELVRRYFSNPVHAGSLPDEYRHAVVGEAAESDSGARVVLSAVTDAEAIRVLRYRIFGCPHLIAAAEAFCEQVEGQAVEALRSQDMQSLMDRLDIPVEKTGRLFILEDAARALHIGLTGKAKTEE